MPNKKYGKKCPFYTGTKRFVRKKANLLFSIFSEDHNVLFTEVTGVDPVSQKILTCKISAFSLCTWVKHRLRNGAKLHFLYFF